jgi:dUTP pyrophosphatase
MSRHLPQRIKPGPNTKRGVVLFYITLRSSTPSRLGLIMPNSPAIIDRDFCGAQDELLVQVLNFTDNPVTVERGTRIAQAMFVRTDRLPLVFGDGPTTASRGGFGSTGS